MFPKFVTANPKKVLKDKSVFVPHSNFPKRSVQNSNSASCRASCFLSPWIEKQPRRPGAVGDIPHHRFVRINCANSDVCKLKVCAQWYDYSTQQAISIFLTGLKSVGSH